VVILFCSLSVVAQPPESPQHRPPQPASAQAQSAEHVPLGQSIAPLYGPWKFHVGDSPADPITHAPLWAEPGFDDSSWESVDLTPERSAQRPAFNDVEPVPGWTAKGHANYWGYAWYRIRLHLNTGIGEKLALAGPSDVDDAYQVFLNGNVLGRFGRFSGSRPVTYYNQPTVFPLPIQFTQSAPGDPNSTAQVLAFRVWMEPNTLVTSPDAGGIRSAPVVGEDGAIRARHKLLRLDLFLKFSPFALDAVLFGLLALVAFSLILFDRSDRVYLWMGAVFLLTSAYSGLGALAVWTQYLSILADSLMTQCFLGPLAYASWVMVWWVWFGRQSPAWRPRAAAALALVYMISNAIALELFFSFIPHPVAFAFEIVSLIVRLLFFSLLLWIVIQAIRSQGIDGWLVLPAIVLLGIGLFRIELSFLHVQLNWFPSGVMIALFQIANLLMAAALALLLLRRLLVSVRRQRLIQMDAQRAQLQSDFVSAVSHEFRSPLTTLRTITEMLVQDRIPDPSRRRESYGFLDRETTRLQELVENLLDFGRMESGRRQYSMETHDAFQLVRAEIDLAAQHGPASGFSIEASLDGVPALVQVDEEALRRAVRNLIENAIKYSPQCRTVWVEGAVSNRHVSISVRDRGMGIDPEEQQVIFQKFFRGSAAKKAGIKGTGIGLAMVRQIVEAMGGEIRLESDPGAGSTFTIVLPLAEDRKGAA